MQKNIIIAGAVVVLVAGLGFWVFASRGDKSGKEMMQGAEQKMQQEKAMVEEKAGDELSGAKAWANAAMLGKKLRCTYSQASGNGQSSDAVMYVDGKKYRTEFQSGNVHYVSVFDGNSIYSWKEGEKQGMQMAVSCMEDMQGTAPDEGQKKEFQSSSEEVIESAPDISCSETEDVDVSIPSDITFSDQCAAIKNQMQQLQNVKSQMPEDAQKMMDSMGNGQ